MTLSGVITVVLLVLKVLNIINISWWIVFAPVVIVALIQIIIFVVLHLILK
jgi:hypothetical protein